MTTNATDEIDGRDADGDRYAELHIGDDEFVIYDRQNHQAWIQSTVVVTARELQ